MSPDIQAALQQALAQAQAQPIPAAQSHVQNVAGAQQMMQALAKAIANQRRPLGQARVAPHPFHSPIDGGYSGAGIRDANGHLIARAGFGPHPVPPQILAPGMIPHPGVSYGQ